MTVLRRTSIGMLGVLVIFVFAINLTLHSMLSDGDGREAVSALEAASAPTDSDIEKEAVRYEDMEFIVVDAGKIRTIVLVFSAAAMLLGLALFFWSASRLGPSEPDGLGKLGAEPAELEHIVACYIAASADNVDGMAAAVKAQDRDALRRLAQNFKNVSDHVSADRVADICQQLSADALGSDWKTLAEKLLTLIEEIDATNEELSRRYGSERDDFSGKTGEAR